MMSTTEHSAFMLVPTAEAYAELDRKMDRVIALLESRRGPSAEDDAGAYVEPGPGSSRQFFSAQELATRWGWGKTKVYELMEDELPAFAHGGTKRFFWSFVWAFEGRISRQEAERIWKDHGTLSASKLKELPRPALQSARIRTVRPD